jgi:uncharacterized protein (DUF305 family)
MESLALCRWSLAAAITAGVLHPSIGVGGRVMAAPPPTAGAGAAPMGRPVGSRSADQHFIVMMIPHHDGAIAMAELALTRSKRPEIRALAEQIKTSQTAENAQMRSWYRQWFGSEVPAWPGGGRGGTDMGMGPGRGMGPGMGMGMGRGMLGMGTSLAALKSAPDFDRTFIEQMISHHRMGVMMASHAEMHTQHRELRDLQAAMVKVQSQEIAQMEQWYLQWYGSSSR